MKSRARAPRGSTLLTSLAVTLLLALIIFGVLAYTGAERERSGRSVRDIDAQSCAESAAQWGRKYYGDNYARWNDMLKPNSGYSNPESTDPSNWGDGSFGRIDGHAVDASHPPDFRVTLSDNIDEFFPATPDSTTDNDLQVVLRAECLVGRLALSRSELVEETRVPTTDPYQWRGQVLSETSQTRRNKVMEVVLIHVPGNEYRGQRGGGTTGDQNVSLVH
ncbi:hypothetical protein [Archangium sp.]|jgi:hypothetical protein|uniref:hypothetical protein n=1 Tax=Archangium sp. TaxID=1872627 RepID=UPI00389ADEC8